MLSDVAFSVYEWSKCAFARHSPLVMEGLIEKMRHIYPLNRRHVFIPLVLFVALAVGFLLLFPGGFAQAQDASNIPYQENGTGPVTTFTATDPEGGAIYWSLLPADTCRLDRRLDANLTDADGCGDVTVTSAEPT